MGRRLALLALVIGASLGGYLAFWGAPEEIPEPVHETPLPLNAMLAGHQAAMTSPARSGIR